MLWLARRAFGLDMRAFVFLSFAVVGLTAALASRLAVDARQPVGLRLALVAACFAVAFQPTQMEHLLWCFEVGWFLVDAVAVVNVALAERWGPRAAGLQAALCVLASLASAQGAFTWFAAGAHQALLPGRRGWWASALLWIGGIGAVARLLWRPHASVSGPVHPDHDLPGILVYAVEILGGLFGLRDHAVLLAGGAGLAGAAALLLWLRRHTPRPDRLRGAIVLMGFSALCAGAFASARHHLGIDWATASFHAAPLLVPFGLGLILLVAAPPDPSRPAAKLPGGAAAVAALLLAAGVASAAPYGLTRARLWAMDRGYARWAACSGQVPDVVAARGSGVDYDLAGFEALRPSILRMCGGATGPLEAALVRRPALFDRLAAGRPDLDRALDALWQDYATDLGLQLAFKPWRADTPARLLAFAKADADKGSEIDPVRLAPYADLYRSLAP